jgi:predicted DNA-binding ribbon-helix-helix protein
VTIRLSHEAFDAIKAAADRSNVSVGALIRECAERYAVSVARDASAGNVVLRRARVERAAVVAPVVPARALVPASVEALGRQAQLNAAKARRS